MPRVTIVDADKISDEAAAAVAEVWQTVNGALRVKLHDKHAALVSIGRYLGMFDDKVKVDAVYGISEEPMSVMNWRRLTPNMESPAPQSVYRTLNLPQKGRQVLGADLNCSESRWGAPGAAHPNDSTPRCAGRPLHCGDLGPSMSPPLCPRKRTSNLRVNR